MSDTNITISKAEAARRHIPLAEFKPCAEAFVDRRNPNSEGKLNYTFIGPGVAQSSTQIVNLTEAHGFNVGGVSLPPNRVNNLHLHFTAEVFISAAGKWEFIWGNEGEQTATFDRRDVITIPTWIFRGFYNRAGDDAFMFAVIGADEPGGIIWNPRVLEDAKQAGLRLSTSSQVIDVQAGQTLPAGEDFLKSLAASELDKLPTYTPEQMEQFIVRWDALDWRMDALPAGGLLAPVLGHGMTAARHHYPQAAHPHSFSIEWLRLGPGESTGAWRTDRSLVAIVYDHTPHVILNGPTAPVPIALEERSLYSVPKGVWREFRNEGTEEAVIMLVHGGDERVRPQWEDKAVGQARQQGLAFDPDGFLAPQESLLAI